MSAVEGTPAVGTLRSSGGEERAHPTPRWRVAIQAETCIGSGICASLAPAAFVLGPDHHSQPVQPEVDEDPSVADAANCCPVQAITVADLSTGDVIAPED